MSIEDRMTIDERRKYFRKMQERYLEADRLRRRLLLDLAVVQLVEQRSS